MCQEHHEEETLTCWIRESSLEKREGLDLLRTLLLCCFFREESQAMKRPSLRNVKCLARKDDSSLLVVVI
jgi:hypothetical protein